MGSEACTCSKRLDTIARFHVERRVGSGSLFFMGVKAV